MKFLIVCILIGLIVFAGVQLKQLILVIKERKKAKASELNADLKTNEEEHKKDKI